jgi:hypothetical protein
MIHCLFGLNNIQKGKVDYGELFSYCSEQRYWAGSS